jgi:hypothetical protein
MVISRSTLRVAVGEPRPVFGMIRSESYSFSVAARETMKGTPNGIAQAAMITSMIKNPLVLNTSVPFLPRAGLPCLSSHFLVEMT